MYARNLEVPSGGGVGTARGIAHAYGVFATGGRELGLRQETLDLLAAPAIPPTRGFYDECMKGDGIQFSLGFMKSDADLAVRQRPLVRIARRRRFAWLCGSGGRHRLRVRDEPDGDGLDRRPARCGAQRGALRRSPELMRAACRPSGRSSRDTRWRAYFALTFAISWGGESPPMPVTREQCFDVFAAYNTALWPGAVALWIASVLICALMLRASGRSAGRVMSALLAIHWAWSGLAYHVAFLTRINPAAWLFAAMFLVQGGLLIWTGVVQGRLRFTTTHSAWTFVAQAFIAYTLVYPGDQRRSTLLCFENPNIWRSLPERRS